MPTLATAQDLYSIPVTRVYQGIPVLLVWTRRFLAVSPQVCRWISALAQTVCNPDGTCSCWTSVLRRSWYPSPFGLPYTWQTSVVFSKDASDIHCSKTTFHILQALPSG